MPTDAKQKIEGYWRRSEAESSDLPWPRPDPQWDGREHFLMRLAALEAAAAQNRGVLDYMGYSPCRICGRENGASEFQFSGWTWPEGYRHYVEHHHVRPSAEFERFVLDRA